MEQSIDELDMRLKESVTRKNLCESLLAICCKQKKLLTSPVSKRVMKSVCDTKEKLRERLVRLKSHKRVVSRTRAVCPRPALISAKKSLQDRIKTLDLTATLPAAVSTTSFDKFIKRIRAELRQLEQQGKMSDEYRPTFHKNRGCSILLEWNGSRANCTDIWGGVVVLSCALESQVLYEVAVYEIRQDWEPNDIMFCGITGTHPNDLTIKNSIWEMEDVLTVCPQGDSGFNENVQVYSGIQFMVDVTNNLHFFLNKNNLGIVLRDVPRPCYVVLDLGINVKQVFTMPVTKIPTL